MSPVFVEVRSGTPDEVAKILRELLAHFVIVTLAQSSAFRGDDLIVTITVVYCDPAIT